MSAFQGEIGQSPQEALRASEERLRLALEAGRMGTWEWEIAAGRVTWSTSLEAIHGLAPGTFAGTFEAFQEDIHPDDRAYVQRGIEESLRSGAQHHIQYRIVRADGSVRWVEGRGRLFRDDAGRPGRMIGVCLDITDRKLAEMAMLDSEERYQRLLTLMPVAVYTCDVSGAITFFNEKAASIWGRSPALGDLDERFCGSLRLWNADGTALPHAETPMALALREGREFRNSEVLIERPDGTRIPVIVNIDPIRDASGRVTGAINVFHDVAERNRADEMQARLAAIVESSDDAILALDRDGRINSWNRGAERLYGYRAEEVVGKPVSLLIPADHEDDFPRIMQRLRSGERLEHYETVRVARDGRRIDVSLTISPIRDARGNIAGASKIARDISERKHNEDTLRARALQQEAVARLGEFALREPDVQRVFQRATEALAETLQIECCKVLELLPEGKELLLRAGVGWRDGLVGTARVGSGADSQAGYTLQSNAPVIVADLGTEQRFRGPALLFDHGIKTGMSCVIRGAAGAAWGVLGCHSKRLLSFSQDDVNFLTAVANILSHAIHRERTEQVLREADRRKDEFIAMLSHELRNPLAPIRSALELLRMNNAGMEPVQIYDIIERQVNHLVRLVDDLLEISRVERGLVDLRRERLALKDVLHGAVETSQPLIEEAGHLLEVEVPSESLWVYGDPVRLAQVFANLLNNAARFTGRGGRIGLAVRCAEGRVAVSVRDTGIGFSQHTRERLFEMFSRSPQSTGLGIGLALARRLVEMHGGTIEAQSAGEGKGAEFVVRLPLAEARASEAAASAVPSDKAQEAARYRVLVADDNRDAAESLGMLLRMMGNDVKLAFDGEEAVTVARGFLPQVALLDVGMPKLDGYGAAREIRSQIRNVRLIALTGWGQDADRRRAREAGFDAHLVKPADLDMLRAALAGTHAGPVS